MNSIFIDAQQGQFTRLTIAISPEGHLFVSDGLKFVVTLSASLGTLLDVQEPAHTVLLGAVDTETARIEVTHSPDVLAADDGWQVLGLTRRGA